MGCFKGGCAWSWKRALGALDLIDGVGTVSLELSFVVHLAFVLQQRHRNPRSDATPLEICNEGVATRSCARNLPPPARPCLENHPQPRQELALQSARASPAARAKQFVADLYKARSLFNNPRLQGAGGACSCERRSFEGRSRPRTSSGCNQGFSGGAVPATPPSQRWPHLEATKGI